MGRRTLPVAIVVAVVALVTARPAHADAEAEADVLISRGIGLREAGRDDEALVVFRRALAQAPTARARAQVGLAEQALGMWSLAEADLVVALARESDPWIVKHRAALEGALAVVRKHVGTLEVRGAERADVFVDGVRVGSGPGPFRVEAGRRSLEVRAPGFQTTRRSIEVLPDGIARETVTLVANQPAPQASTTRAGAEETVTSPPSHTSASGQRILGWTFLGTGAALLATGGAALLVRQGIIDHYNVECPGVGVPQSSSCEDQVSASHTWLTVAILTLVGGGAVATGGALFVATAPSTTKGHASSALGPRFGCGPGASASAASVTCAGVF